MIDEIWLPVVGFEGIYEITRFLEKKDIKKALNLLNSLKKAEDNYMCFVCRLLEGSFPSPKGLAQALFEVKDVGAEHEQEIFEKVSNELIKQSEAYLEEFTEEAIRLGELG